MIRAWCAAGLLLAAMEVRADAAIKAQEGEIKHWIEYYEKQRATAKPEEQENRGPGTQDSGLGKGRKREDSGRGTQN